MSASTVIIGLAVGALALTAGCGGDDDRGAATRIEADASEFEFDPDTWAVPAGEEVTIDFENDGEVEHEWVIINLGEDIASEREFAEDKVLFEVEATDPGTEVQETFNVQEAGTYQVICAIPGHFDAGMEGELTVE